MSVSIKVCIRCRPFVCDNKLGVHMIQSGDEDGEVNLLNSTYTTRRFAFTWSWWSAYGWERRAKSDHDAAREMKLIDQNLAYAAVGTKVKKDLMAGNAVVIFAYGLSGSGKTFTVFGPDAADAPDAWFKHGSPHPMWGVFPRLAYDVFQMKEDMWKIIMKYFQNVVDIVRDLMSPTGVEKNYKQGMRKDEDGFTDIIWCQDAQLDDWDHLRKTFLKANARKAISPTQFNHQSTRGHCIMTLEVKMPVDGDPSRMQRGRVYICDLAGTEPAGDIVYANYKKVTFPDGTVEHNYLGPHPDQSKTKNLQNQGKKINLSLSEMAQFFMKMAQAIKKKRLKPGKSIPGCNSYFLCKYLKDTMLQARTYLFCAIRPEVKFLNYTFSTLGFAKNASVIKLQPKKATTAATPAERKLMQELEKLKIMFEQLQKENEQLLKSIDPNAVVELSVEKTEGLEAALKEKQLLEKKLTAQKQEAREERDKLIAQQSKLKADLEEMQAAGLEGMDEVVKRQMLAKQRELEQLLEKERAAAALSTEQDKEIEKLIVKVDDRMDENFTKEEVQMVSAKRNMREMMQQKKAAIMAQFTGKKSNAQKAQDNKMEVQREEYAKRGISLAYFEEKTTQPHLINLDEDTFRSKRYIYMLTRQCTWFGPKGDVYPVSLNIVRKHCCVEFGTTTHILVGGNGDLYHNGKKVKKGRRIEMRIYDRIVIGGEVMLYRWSGKGEDPGFPEPEADMVIAEYQKALSKKSGGAGGAHTLQRSGSILDMSEQEMIPGMTATDYEIQKQLLDKEMLELYPKTKELKKLMVLIGRDELCFDVTFSKGVKLSNAVMPKVKVKVYKSDTKENIFIDTFEFRRGFSTIKDEILNLRNAIDNGRSYTVDHYADPIYLFFDNTFHVGSALSFPEHMGYLLETAEEERMSDIKSSQEVDASVGKVDIMWTPLESPDDEDVQLPATEFVEDPKLLIGKELTYRCNIGAVEGLDMRLQKAYIQYEFFGELFTTNTVEETTSAPNFEYSFVHHVPQVTEEFLEWCKTPIEYQLFVSMHVQEPKTVITSEDPALVSRITGRSARDKRKSNRREDSNKIKKLQKEKQLLETQIVALTTALAAAREQITSLGHTINPLTPRTRTTLTRARFSDRIFNEEKIGQVEKRSTKIGPHGSHQNSDLKRWKTEKFSFRHNSGAVVQAVSDEDAKKLLASSQFSIHQN